jgi:hypothetical protein
MSNLCGGILAVDNLEDLQRKVVGGRLRELYILNQCGEI